MAITTAAAFFERVKAALMTGSSARTRIGTFYVQTFPGYEGRNPRTGEVIPVPPKRLPAFVASDELTARVLGPRAEQTHAEGHAELERNAADATLAPSVEVACSDEELDACVRALAAELAHDHRVEIAPLGALVLAQQMDRHGLRVRLQAADELRAAMDGK